MGADKEKKKPSPKKAKKKPKKDHKAKSKPATTKAASSKSPPKASKISKVAKASNDEKAQRPSRAKKTPNTPAKQRKSGSTDRNRQVKLTRELHDEKLPYFMKELIPVYNMEIKFAEELRGKMGRTFRVGDVAKGKSATYMVIEVLGSRTYVVEKTGTDATLVMRTEGAVLPSDAPILRREYIFLHCSKEGRYPYNRSHFMRIFDITDNAGDPTYSAIFVNRCLFDLDTVRLQVLDKGEFSEQTAIRLCMQTLQAIHDVHLVGFIHRDIQPKNFLVGTNGPDGVSQIYITGFAYSFDIRGRDAIKGIPSYRQLAKLPTLNSIFQSHLWHAYRDIVHPDNDLESWIYMCYNFFNTKSLPWAYGNHSEKWFHYAKRAVFTGLYDSHFDKFGIPPMMHKVRDYVFNSPNPIEYETIALILMNMAKEFKVDWKKPYEWQAKGPPTGSHIAPTQAPTPISQPSNTPTSGGVQETPVQTPTPISTPQLGTTPTSGGVQETPAQTSTPVSQPNNTPTGGGVQETSDEESSSESSKSVDKHKRRKKKAKVTRSATTDQDESDIEAEEKPKKRRKKKSKKTRSTEQDGTESDNETEEAKPKKKKKLRKKKKTASVETAQSKE